MKKNRFYIFITLLFFIPKTSFALIEVDITRGNLNPLPIAVSPLFVESKSIKDFQNILKKKKHWGRYCKCCRKKLKVFRTF